MTKRVMLAALIACATVEVSAQLSAPNALGVSMSHLHYRVRDVAANRKFWVTLGGQPATIDGIEALRFPDVLVFLVQGDSPGGTEGSVVNHVAFRVPSLAQVAAAGLKVDLTPGFPGVGSTRTPEGERIELFDDTATNLVFTPDAGQGDITLAAIARHRRPVGQPIAFHHIHLYVREGDAVAAKNWYARMFGGIPGKRSNYDAVDLPGVNMNFSGNPQATVATKGRMLDHIGFEVRNLEAFCRRLESMGVKLENPYATSASGIGFARLIDPWGTSIELTEGLRGL